MYRLVIESNPLHLGKRPLMNIRVTYKTSASDVLLKSPGALYKVDSYLSLVEPSYSFESVCLYRPSSTKPLFVHFGNVSVMGGNIADMFSFDPPHPDYDNPAQRTWLPAFSLVWQILTTLVVLGRFYLRAKHKGGGFGFDDSLMLIARVSLELDKTF